MVYQVITPSVPQPRNKETPNMPKTSLTKAPTKCARVDLNIEDWDRLATISGRRYLTPTKQAWVYILEGIKRDEAQLFQDERAD